MLEGDDAREQLDEEQRRTNSRRELSRNDSFEDISPEVGELDPAAVEEALSEDADDTLSLLADLTGATDVKLRELARDLAGRIVVDLARTGKPRVRGVGRLASMPMDDGGGDLDLDASIEAIGLARATGGAPPLDELVARTWTRPGLALCLLIDRSGSMTGARLAAAAVAVAAASERAPQDHAVVAFSDQAVVVKGRTERRDREAVINDVFRLRGFGPTDLSLALRVAAEQLADSRAGRKRVILFSDCRPTAGTAPEEARDLIEDLHIVAPSDDCEDARIFADAVGARFAELSGPSAVPEVFQQLLD